MLDEPTAEIDVGAKADILTLVRNLAAEGVAIILISSEFEEILAVADRVLVMRDGVAIAERMAARTTNQELILLASGTQESDASGSRRSTPVTMRAANASRKDWAQHFGLREAGVFYALALLLIVLGAATYLGGRPNYFSATNLTNILYQSSMIAMMGVAMTVILITGNFDLSVASVAALGAAITVGLAGPLGLWTASFAALAACGAVGVLNGAIVQYVGINAFIVTLGTLTAIRGLVLIVTDGRSLIVSTPEAKAQMVAFEGSRVSAQPALLAFGAALIALGVWRFMRLRAKNKPLPLSVPGSIVGGVALLLLAYLGGATLSVAAPVVYTAIYTAIVWGVLNFTTIGRRVYATGGNAIAARLSGVNVSAYKMAGFILSSATAGFAGILFGSRLAPSTRRPYRARS